MFDLSVKLRQWGTRYAHVVACETRLSEQFLARTGIAFEQIDFTVRQEMLSEAVAEGVEATLDRYLSLEAECLARAPDRDAAVMMLLASYGRMNA